MQTCNQEWQKQVVHWEYCSAAKPSLNELAIQPFPASLHQSGDTRIIELNLSKLLNTDYAATSPALLAHYIRLCKNEHLQSQAQASSEVFYVMRGAGYSLYEGKMIRWQAGDVFTLPCNQGVEHHAEEDSALYWTHDAPLLQFLGTSPTQKRFKPAFYDHRKLYRDVHELRDIAVRENRNRAGIILGQETFEAQKSMTHSMWSLFNILPKNVVQKAHRHQSVALDLAVSAADNTYTLIGKHIDDQGDIIEPVKALWSSQSVFVTPPGLWHSHHNESDSDAYVFPVQDAGLHNYLRTLDIQFVS